MMRIFTSLTLLVFLAGCIKNNPDPAWLEVNSMTLVSNPALSGAEGQLTQDFRDVWVYIDDQMLGCFQVPFKIPVLKEGNVNIKIFPAVRNNGISANKMIYPFMNSFEVNATFVKNQTLTLNPVTSYKDNINFWIEDFEDASIKIQEDPNYSVANLFTTSESIMPFNGSTYGKVILNSSDSVWLAYTTDQLAIPKNKACFLEIDYYNTNSFLQGFLAVSALSNKYQDNAGFNKQPPATVKWKKMYIELTELIGNSANDAHFVQAFKANLESGMSESFICIDNVKIVYK